MFDSLSEKLQSTLGEVRQRGSLSEQDVDAAMREIRLALLEADVNFKVVREFTSHVKARCLDEELVGKLNPGQQVVKIVGEELTELMGGPPTPGSPGGGEEAGLMFSSSPPTVVLMAGQPGSGNTRAAGELPLSMRSVTSFSSGAYRSLLSSSTS